MGDFYFGGIVLVPGIRHQVQFHLDRVGGVVDPAALYFVNIGENDLNNVAQAVWQEQGWDAALMVVEAAAEGTLDAVQMLADHGGIHFVVTPTSSANGIGPGRCDSPYGDDLFDAFNSLLRQGLAEIEGDLSIVYGGEGLLKQISQHFVICVSCVHYLEPFPVCDNPNELFFWDNIGHPSAPVHQLVGDALTILVLRNRVGELMDEGTLNVGEATSLEAKLDGAYGKLGDRKPKTAVNKAGAFANEVQAFVQAGRLTPEQAELLLIGAYGIVDQP
jgi:phospholipase/lecithinase/hemolysin